MLEELLAESGLSADHATVNSWVVKHSPTLESKFRNTKKAVGKSGSNKSALDSCNCDLSEGNEMEIRQVKYLNNSVEQDHRFIKKRTRPTLVFKNFYSAAATITGIENIRMIQKGQIFGCNSTSAVFHNFCALMA